MEMIDANCVERGSAWRVGDGEKVSGEVDDDGSSDKRLPAMKVWM
jgi:hypothetical protein